MSTQLRRRGRGTYRLGLLFFLLLGHVAEAHAQQARDTVVARSRVRLAVPQHDPSSSRGRSYLLVGTALFGSPDSLWLQPGGTPDTIALPWTAIRRFEVSRGLSRARTALLYAADVGIGGAILCGSFCDDRFPSRAVAAVMGGVVGAVLGAALGVVRPRERWSEVSVPAFIER